jgi:hypothetical protein
LIPLGIDFFFFTFISKSHLSTVLIRQIIVE